MLFVGGSISDVLIIEFRHTTEQRIYTENKTTRMRTVCQCLRRGEQRTPAGTKKTTKNMAIDPSHLDACTSIVFFSHGDHGPTVMEPMDTRQKRGEVFVFTFGGEWREVWPPGVEVVSSLSFCLLEA